MPDFDMNATSRLTELTFETHDDSQRPAQGLLFIPLSTSLHTVDLSGCSWLCDDDMNNLDGVHTLRLDGCTLVTDVSALTDVYSLSMTGSAVLDVSPLAGVHTLNLSGGRVKDVRCLGTVHTLNLSNCENVDTVEGLGGLYFLDVSRNHLRSLLDVNSVHTLIANDVHLADGIFPLGSCHHLSIVQSPNSPKYPLSFGDVESAQALQLSNIPSPGNLFLKSLTHVRELYLGGVEIVDVSWTAHLKLKKLELASCYDLVSLDELKDLEALTLLSCTKLASLSGMSNIRAVSIYSCPLVTNVSILTGVKHLTVKHCVGLPRGWLLPSGLETLITTACNAGPDPDSLHPYLHLISQVDCDERMPRDHPEKRYLYHMKAFRTTSKDADTTGEDEAYHYLDHSAQDHDSAGSSSAHSQDPHHHHHHRHHDHNHSHSLGSVDQEDYASSEEEEQEEQEEEEEEEDHYISFFQIADTLVELEQVLFAQMMAQHFFGGSSDEEDDEEDYDDSDDF